MNIQFVPRKIKLLNISIWSFYSLDTSHAFTARLTKKGEYLLNETALCPNNDTKFPHFSPTMQNMVQIFVSQTKPKAINPLLQLNRK